MNIHILRRMVCDAKYCPAEKMLSCEMKPKDENGLESALQKV